MKQYKTINTLSGWIVFLIAAVVYIMTAEPSVSFWDCGEFLTSGDKLEIGHPPGAPFFMLMSNFAALFASGPDKIAYHINMMSALMSALCILFLFWSITHLVRKLLVDNDERMTVDQMITIIASGAVGALAYAFSDTFWFSAVEAEVYGTSSMFTAFVFWLILKWEESANEPHSDRWLVLIAYCIGLSIGVHLLNLLCLPAIVLVYYYKKNPDADLKGSIGALIGSAVLLAAVLYGVVPGVLRVAGWFEVWFVNDLGFSFNSGTLFYLVLLAASLIWGVYESYTQLSRQRMNIAFLLTVALLGIPFFKEGAWGIVIGIAILGALALYLFAKKLNKKYQISARTLNTAMLCMMTIMIGYSSYALIIIRSSANTPMDQNSPEDVFSLTGYVNREQYGSRPLLYGQTYASQVVLQPEGQYCTYKFKEGPKRYIRKDKTTPEEKDVYIEAPGRGERVFAQNMLFPRMWSQDATHIADYKRWANVKGHDVPYDQCGKIIMVNIPTQWENLKFFFKYQVNYMYWRYFMWNFVGRQNDLQGQGEIEHGNWITGFKFIDNLLVGDQDLMPDSLKNNKGRNVYYGLPLLLGIIGLLWQARRNRKGIQQFWVVFFLFFMTGIAVILYLNQPPMQVRERDYAYAASFYAFAIWIGMSVPGIVQLLRRYAHLKKRHAVIAVSVFCMLIPLQMVSQTWDDHDRSDRFICRDIGQNYLSSLQDEGHPIIFTNGDNDTFPLWYNQEVEEFRTDARTCNLSYLATDWYIDQMKRPAYDSPSLPIRWSRTEYKEGNNDVIRVQPAIMKQLSQLYDKTPEGGLTTTDPKLIETLGENPYELKNILDKWVRSTDENRHFIPTDSIVLKVDKDAVCRSGMKIPKALGDSIPDYMHISLKGKNMLLKSELMMLEMLANANWERPIYMAITVGPSEQLNMQNHFVQEGLTYRFTPFDTKQLGATIDVEKMYDNLMNKFKFGNMNKPGIYIDENAMRMCNSHRGLFATLLDTLAETDTVRASAAFDYCEKMIPGYNVPYNYSNQSQLLFSAAYKLKRYADGDRIAQIMATEEMNYVLWYLSMNDAQLNASFSSLSWAVSRFDDIVKTMETYKSQHAAHYRQLYDTVYRQIMQRVK